MTPVDKKTTTWDGYNQSINEIEEASEKSPLFGFSAAPNIDEIQIFNGRLPKEYSGLAKFTATSGIIYEGIFEKGNLIQGSITFTNGIIFQGKFKHGFAYGECTVTLANGVSYQGHCLNNTFLNRITFSDGSTYSGELKNFQPHGDGRFEFANGLVHSGEFRYGKLYKGLCINAERTQLQFIENGEIAK